MQDTPSEFVTCRLLSRSGPWWGAGGRELWILLAMDESAKVVVVRRERFDAAVSTAKGLSLWDGGLEAALQVEDWNPKAAPTPPALLSETWESATPFNKIKALAALAGYGSLAAAELEKSGNRSRTTWFNALSLNRNNRIPPREWSIATGVDSCLFEQPIEEIDLIRKSERSSEP